MTTGNRQSVITLLTDFGTQDYFVAAMKGVILTRNPAALIVDISHDIPPQNIRAAAFNLLAVYRDFPAGTTHIAVVDPGVGSSRRVIVIECAGQLFVGPDNGLFSWICQREGKFQARQVTNDSYFRQPVSQTFHGRDIFAPIGAALSSGARPKDFGPVRDQIVELEPLNPQSSANGAIAATIINIDRFGNCVTSLASEILDQSPRPLTITINDRQVSAVRRFYADAADNVDEVFMVPGSAGFVEISARNASAAAILSAKIGQAVVVCERHEAH